MENVHGIGGGDQAALLNVVRGVRSRWRLKRALRGAAITVAGSFAFYAIVALALGATNYPEGVMVTARILCVVVIVALTVRFVIVPQLPKVRDEQVALYLEEHEPTLDGVVVTAVEVEGAALAGVSPRSAGLAQRLTYSAVERARTVDGGRRVDAESLQRGWAMLAGVLIAATMLTILGPSPLRNGLRLLAMPWDHAAPAPRFSISVEPGNMTIAKGGDALVGARLRGFQSEQVVVLMRGVDSASWIRVPMVADTSGRYTARLLDISQPTEYAVEANGVKSTTYRIDVTNLPYVKTLDMEYRYPAYTGLSPEKFDSAGDIAALKGTMVRLTVHPTMPTTGGRVIVDDAEALKLLPNKDGSLSAVVRVSHTGFYKIELAGPDGKMVTGSLDYTIDMLPDRPPTVHFNKPGHDTKVHAVDEVYTEASAKDDYGVARLELVYSVNGADERTLPLSQATSRILKEISAGHTFMLEDYQLQAGDVVSYFARAVDNDAVSGAKSATTDIYFLNVNPYARDYRQGQPPEGAGGGGGEPPGQFSQREREIISATFKSSRDSTTTEKKALGENIQTVRLSQQKLREDVEGLARRLVERGIAARDTNYAKIAKILPKAAAMMDTAEKTLGAGKITAARGPEQRALTELQRAEAVFKDITVAAGGGGGGGGGGAQQAQDLADLFELRQERLRNQYEQVQRGQQQQQQQQGQTQKTIDSLAQKLKELAQRQQTEDERARAKADSMNQGRQQQQGGGGGGGGQQRQMAQQAEDAARQLERLAREQQSQTLGEAARALQTAANEMRKSAASGQQNGQQSGQSGSAMSPEAQKALEEARRLMDQERKAGDQRDVSDALQQARQLQAEQQRVNADAARMNTADSAGARQAVAQRSGQMADQLKDLTRQMDRIAQNNRQDQPATSRAVKSAADSVRSTRLENQIRAAQQLAAGSAPANYLRDVTEPQISQGIDNLNRQLEQAQQAANAAQNQQKGAQSLDKTRDAVSGLQSLEERIQQRADQQNARRLAAGGSQNGQQQNGQQQNGQQQNGQQQNGQQQNGQQQNGQQQNGQQQNGQQTKGQQAKGQQTKGQQGQRQQGQGQQGQGQQGQGQQGQGQQGQGQGQGQQGQAQQGQGQGQQGQGQGQQGQGQGRAGQQQQGGNGGAPGNGGMSDQQFQRELAQRLNDIEALRRELARQGRDVSQLDQALSGLKGISTLESLSDARTAKALHAQVEALKNFEFQLNRAVAGEKEGVRVGRVGDVPPSYRQWVEQYYREIGKTPPAKSTPKVPPK